MRSRQAGFDYHIVKPIEPAALTGLLATLRSCRKDRAPAADTNASGGDVTSGVGLNSGCACPGAEIRERSATTEAITPREA